MRYGLSAVVSGMFILVACPQQRLPQLQPQQPGVGAVTETKTVVPPSISKKAAFNPGNLTIEPTSNRGGANFIKEAGKDAQGVEQHNIELTTDLLWAWGVEAGAEGLDHRDILLESAFNQQRGLELVRSNNNGRLKQQEFVFRLPYQENAGPASIAPMSIHVVARNKKYCRDVFNAHADTGVVEAVNGFMPDVPKSLGACDRMKDGELYNFDQKLRLNLHIENVRDKEMQQKADAQHRRREALICGIVNRITENVLAKAQENFGNNQKDAEGNTKMGWGDLIRGIVMDIGAEALTYKISMRGYNCSAY